MLTRFRNELSALRSAVQYYRRERRQTPMTMAEQALALLTIERQRQASLRQTHDEIERKVRRLYEASRFATKPPRDTTP